MSQDARDIVAKIRTLVSPDDPTRAPDKDVIDRLYKMLDVLDGKANGLMRVNSLLIAICLSYIAVSRVSTVGSISLPPWMLYAVIFDIVILVTSTILCLLIVKMSWRFLGHVAADEAGRWQFGDKALRLAGVVGVRTRLFWIAWWAPMSALAALLGVWLAVAAAG